MRGGGGNFGIVTSFQFRLHPLGPEVYFAAQFFAIDDAPQVMRKWRDFVEAAADDISSLGLLWTVPSVEGFPPELRGKRVFLYGALYAGSAEAGEKALAPLRGIGKPVLDLSGPGPLTRRGKRPSIPSSCAGRSIRKSMRTGNRSISRVSTTPWSTISSAAERARPPISASWLCGIWGEPSPGRRRETSLWGRKAAYLLSYDSCWIDPKQGDAVVQWTRDQIEAAKPHSPGGSYLNFPGVGADADAVREAYGPNYERLAKIKAKYDLANMFRMNQNIVPLAL